MIAYLIMMLNTVLRKGNINMKRINLIFISLILCAFLITGCSDGKDTVSKNTDKVYDKDLITFSDLISQKDDAISKIKSTDYGNLDFSELTDINIPDVDSISDIKVKYVTDTDTSKIYDDLMHLYQSYFSDKLEEEKFKEGTYYRLDGQTEDKSLNDSIDDIKNNKLKINIMGIDNNDAYACYGSNGVFFNAYRGDIHKYTDLGYTRAKFEPEDDLTLADNLSEGKSPDEKYQMMDGSESSAAEQWKLAYDFLKKSPAYKDADGNHDFNFDGFQVYQNNDGKSLMEILYSETLNGIPLDFMPFGDVKSSESHTFANNYLYMIGSNTSFPDGFSYPAKMDVTYSDNKTDKVCSLPDICDFVHKKFSESVNLKVRNISMYYFLQNTDDKGTEMKGHPMWRLLCDNTETNETVVIYADPLKEKLTYDTYIYEEQE